MEIKVNLDNIWTDYDYGDTVASLIKSEIEIAVRTEIRTTIRKTIKEQIDGVRKQIEAEIKKTTPAKLARLMEALKE